MHTAKIKKMQSIPWSLRDLQTCMRTQIFKRKEEKNTYHTCSYPPHPEDYPVSGGNIISCYVRRMGGARGGEEVLKSTVKSFF